MNKQDRKDLFPSKWEQTVEKVVYISILLYMVFCFIIFIVFCIGSWIGFSLWTETW